MSIVAWPDGSEKVAPDWYVNCFRTALRRIAVVLNSSKPFELCKSADLRSPDQSLDALFVSRGWDDKVIQFNPAAKDSFANVDEYSAEYFFYCDVDFPKRSDRVAKFVVPQTFLDWGYRRLHPPVGDAGTLGMRAFGENADSELFIKHCATNYLVKNFWHNFVHRAIQGIGSHNYHEFRGPAREDSDFEADHLANLLLARSYGLKVHSRGKISTAAQRELNALFRRNRCNLIFAERAQHRRTDRARMSREERWAELEWRFCRAVANAVSTSLIQEGLASPSVRVFLGGEIKTARVGKGGGTKTWRRGGSVTLEIAGRRINSDAAPYLPDDELRAELGEYPYAEVPTHRLADMRANRQKREKEIVQIVVSAFRRLIHDDEALRESIASSMDALARRLSILSFSA
jgi:hypothetical protein